MTAIFFFESLDYFVKFKQPSNEFHTTEKCVGCGKYAKICPVNNIRTENKRPVRIKDCAHFMAYIGNCPFEAIGYGNISQHKVRYNIKKYLDK